MTYRTLAIDHPQDLIFGTAPNPVTSGRGLVFGGGRVYPEVNFTVPEGTVINRATLPALADSYAEAVRGILQRAVELHSSGLTIEFETLLEMTLDPFIGVELMKRMNDVAEEYYRKNGLKSEIRLTPNDTREYDHPPKSSTSRYLDNMLKLFDEGAKAGGNLLSIESIGGKEICDDALTACDIRRVVFALAVVGVRDMRFLWKQIVGIARNNGKIAGGDTACGFGNTAMVLAERQYIPRVFAAVVRVITAVRSLVAVEEGATGPDKDCGYEGVYLKAIAGIPISMEGKTAACAHFSPVGNVASACADLWSNESIQNIKLLGGMSPTVSLEQLEYDARLMNTASGQGPSTARMLQNLMVESDIHTDPQALVLAPDIVIEVSREIVSGRDYLEATVKGALKALEIIGAAVKEGSLLVPKKEIVWIDRIQDQLASIPLDEGQFIEDMMPNLDTTKFDAREYGL